MVRVLRGGNDARVKVGGRIWFPFIKLKASIRTQGLPS